MLAAARILRRAWQIYVAHIFLFTIFMAEIAYVAATFENPLYAEEMKILDFLEQPDITIFQALLLKFKPANMDVLPLYIVLLLLFPPVLFLLIRQPDFALGASASSTPWPGNSISTCRPIRTASGSSIRSPGSSFSCSAPGAPSAAREARRPAAVAHPVGGRGGLPRVCIFYHADVAHRIARRFVPGWLAAWMYPIDKTNLDVLRFAHFLALAAITVRFIPIHWSGLKSPFLQPAIRCGQHSLEIFCLGVFLAFAGQFIIADLSGGPVLQTAISVLGIFIMIATASLISWYKSIEGRGPARARAPVRRPRGGRGMTLIAAIVASLAFVYGAAAAETAPTCEVPDSLPAEVDLARVANAIKDHHPLYITVVGSASSALAGPDGARFAYPAQLEAALRSGVPGNEIKVTAHIQSRQTPPTWRRAWPVSLMQTTTGFGDLAGGYGRRSPRGRAGRFPQQSRSGPRRHRRGQCRCNFDEHAI